MEVSVCPAFTSARTSSAGRAAPGTGAPCRSAGCRRGFARVGLGCRTPQLSSCCQELGVSVAVTASAWASPAQGQLCAGEASTAHTITSCFPGRFSCRCTPSRCPVPGVPQFPCSSMAVLLNSAREASLGLAKHTGKPGCAMPVKSKNYE